MSHRLLRQLLSQVAVAVDIASVVVVRVDLSTHQLKPL
jgi:hypothetical protein